MYSFIRFDKHLDFYKMVEVVENKLNTFSAGSEISDGISDF